MTLRQALCVGAALAGLRLCAVENDAEVAATLKPILAKHGVPALAAALVTGAGLERCGAAGVRKNGAGEPVTADDLWHLGSDTKAMTATLVGLLVEQGKLTWDTRVAEVFPELAPAFHSDCEGVTVRQLLAHRGGVKKDLPWGALSRTSSDVNAQRLHAVREGLSEKPVTPCGTTYLYSNFGYVILGAVIERVTGSTWETAVSERVFKPLGMTRAGFGGIGTPGQIDQPWGCGERPGRRQSAGDRPCGARPLPAERLGPLYRRSAARRTGSERAAQGGNLPPVANACRRRRNGLRVGGGRAALGRRHGADAQRVQHDELRRGVAGAEARLRGARLLQSGG